MLLKRQHTDNERTSRGLAENSDNTHTKRKDEASLRDANTELLLKDKKARRKRCNKVLLCQQRHRGTRRKESQGQPAVHKHWITGATHHTSTRGPHANCPSKPARPAKGRAG